MLWRSPSVGGSKLIRADQQSCALPGVLGTTLGPEIDFSHSTSMMPKQSAWVMLCSPPQPLTPFGGGVLYPPPTVHASPSTPFKVGSFAVGLSLTCARASAFRAPWVWPLSFLLPGLQQVKTLSA